MKKIAAFALALFLLPALSEAKTLEELLVEKGVISEGEVTTASQPAGAKVYWNNGTRLEFPDTGFKVNINTQLQERYSYTDNDKELGENVSSFETRRARIQVSGTALNEEFAYKLQADFVGHKEDDGTRDASLQDAYIIWQPCDPDSGFQFGQFKTAVSRQYNASSSKLQFPERSITSEAFDLGREQGAAMNGTFMDGALVARAQVFNGESEDEGQNIAGQDDKHTYAGSLRIAPIGKVDPTAEGDIEYSKDLGWDLGAAYAHSDRLIGGLPADRDTASADTNLVIQGFSTHAEFFWADDDEDDSSPTGGHVQAGYYIVPQKMEIAARYSYMDCDNGTLGECDESAVPGGVDSLNSVDLSFNYYFWKHNLKAQLAYSFLDYDPIDSTADDVNSNKIIFQVSSYF